MKSELPWGLQAAIQTTHSLPLIELGLGRLGGAEAVIYANLPLREDRGWEREVSFMKTFHDSVERGRRDL